jgi:hypothetical protein
MAPVSPSVSVPRAPAAAALSGKASEEFNALKQSLSDVASWEISPNYWDKIQIAYRSPGSEKQARAFLKALELPTPEM